MTDIDALLAERGKKHGDFTDHAAVTQSLKITARCAPNWNDLKPIQKESIEMILHKIGRVLSGDPDHHDHWIDIAGYAQLVADRVQLFASKPKHAEVA